MVQLTTKARRTKQAIRDTFFSQLSYRKLDTITVRQITDLTGINRSTFYLYYTDLNDLIEEIEFQIIEKLEHRIRSVIPLVLSGRVDEAKDLLKESHLQEYTVYLKALLGPTGDPSFVYQLKKIWKAVILEEVPDLPQTKGMDYILEFTSAAQVALFSKWTIQNMDISSDEFIDLMYKMLFQGPLSVGMQMFLPYRNPNFNK